MSNLANAIAKIITNHSAAGAPEWRAQMLAAAAAAKNGKYRLMARELDRAENSDAISTLSALAEIDEAIRMAIPGIDPAARSCDVLEDLSGGALALVKLADSTSPEGGFDKGGASDCVADKNEEAEASATWAMMIEDFVLPDRKHTPIRDAAEASWIERRVAATRAQAAAEAACALT